MTDRRPVVLFAAKTERWEQYEGPLRTAFDAAGLEDAILTTEADPAEVDYIVYAPNSGLTDFTPFTRLKAVLNLWAGVEDVTGNPTLKVPLARMVDDGLTEGMVEWVTGHVLRHHLGMDTHIHGQDGVWRAGSAPPLARDRIVAVLGLGVLGAACARALSALNFRVLGWSRSPKTIEGVETAHGAEGLDATLRQAEIVVLLLPDTPATENTLNARTLSLLPRGAVIVNPGRGPLIDDDALLEARQRACGPCHARRVQDRTAAARTPVLGPSACHRDPAYRLGNPGEFRRPRDRREHPARRGRGAVPASRGPRRGLLRPLLFVPSAQARRPVGVHAGRDRASSLRVLQIGQVEHQPRAHEPRRHGIVRAEEPDIERARLQPRKAQSLAHQPRQRRLRAGHGIDEGQQVPLTPTGVTNGDQRGATGQPRRRGQPRVERRQQRLRQRAGCRDLRGGLLHLVGPRRQHLRKPRYRCLVQQHLGPGAEVDGQPETLPREHARQSAPRQRRVGRDLPREARQPLLPVEDADEGTVLHLEDARTDAITFALRLEQQEQLGGRQPVEPAQARGLRSIGLHGREHVVERCRHARTSLTRARRTGRSSASNHGFRLSHAVLRHDGCGKGKTAGAWSRQPATRAVTLCRPPRCQPCA